MSDIVLNRWRQLTKHAMSVRRIIAMSVTGGTTFCNIYELAT